MSGSAPLTGPRGTRSRRGRAGHRPPCAAVRRRPARADTSRRPVERARPASRASRTSHSQSVRSSTVPTSTFSIRMPCSTSSPSHVLTTAIAPPSRIAGNMLRRSNAVSKTASTPAGTSLADGGGEPVAAREDDVGAEASDELLVLGYRVREHAETARLRDRDHVGREHARAPGDGERLPLDEPEQLETVQRGEPVHRQRRRLLRCDAVRDRDDGRRRRRPRAPPARRLRGGAARSPPSPRRRPRGARRPHRRTRRSRRRPSRGPRAEAPLRRRAAATRCPSGSRRRPRPRAGPHPGRPHARRAR